MTVKPLITARRRNHECWIVLRYLFSGQCYFAWEIDRGGYRKGSKGPKYPRPLCKFTKCATVRCSLLSLPMAADATVASSLPLSRRPRLLTSPHRPSLHLPSTKDAAARRWQRDDNGEATRQRQQWGGGCIGGHGRGEERAVGSGTFYKFVKWTRAFWSFWPPSVTPSVNLSGKVD